MVPRTFLTVLWIRIGGLLQCETGLIPWLLEGSTCEQPKPVQPLSWRYRARELRLRMPADLDRSALHAR